jgi:hypothetical protein
MISRDNLDRQKVRHGAKVQATLIRYRTSYLVFTIYALNYEALILRFELYTLTGGKVKSSLRKIF